jgi:capsular exopolysaccharide synthesis family protein
LTQKSAEAQAALQQERQRRTEQHPSIVQAAANVAEINRQIDTLAQSIRNSVRERYEVSRRQEQQLAGTVSRLESETLTDQGKGVQYNVLKREADTNRHVYNSLLQRLNEASVAAATPHNVATLLDRAEPSATPVAPRPAEYAAWGLLAGLGLSLLYLFGVVILDDGVHSPDELSAKLRVPLLGVLPLVKRPIQALEDEGSPLSEAHHSLRTTLELGCTRAGLKTILFTSSTEGEGKSAAAYGMARTFALGGKRVLLLDADMRKPSVHRHFGVEGDVGLSTILAGRCDAGDAIVETSLPGLWILPAGPIPQSAAALLSGKQFGSMIGQLATTFDVMVIDGPPVFGLADSPRLAAAAASTILIVEANRAKIANVRMALRRLAEARATVIGAVLTKFDVRRASGEGANLYVYGYGKSHAGELTAA